MPYIQHSSPSFALLKSGFFVLLLMLFSFFLSCIYLFSQVVNIEVEIHFHHAFWEEDIFHVSSDCIPEIIILIDTLVCMPYLVPIIVLLIFKSEDNCRIFLP